ncbi:MAG: glycoside hydrolase, partial [Muribaculaceae bacterium]|nr:glycoside hydrolase [Muribaculaceae bacterium]
MKRLSAIVVLCALLAGVHVAAAPKWIAVAGSENEPNSWYCFQKDLYVAEPVDSGAVVRIACDSKYWLWINGRQVVLEGSVKRGPNPSDTYFDDVDVAPYLRSGSNVVSVLVWYFGKDGFSHKSSGRGALIVDGGSVVPGLDSDASWRGAVHPAYYTPEGDVPNYRLPESNIGFDAGRDIAGWETTYQDSWLQAEEIGLEGDAPWGMLHHRVIPQWRDFGLRDYVDTYVRHGSECDTLVAVLPYNAQVMPYMEVEASAGRRIGIVTDNYAGGGELNLRAEYITADGLHRYENKGWINGHKVYYIYPHDVTVRKVMYRETGYDTDMAGEFRCDDDFFNLLWRKAVRTLYITMRDTYMDCPDRERAQWWGDVVNESGEAFYALSVSSHKLMKKGMYELIGWQRPDSTIHSPVPGCYDHELPGQMLASVGRYGFWNYYLNTGDLQPIRDLYDGVGCYLKVWSYEPDGTVAPRKGGWHWGDWGDNIDKTVLYNAWYYMALDGYRLMSEALGEYAAADSLAAEMKSLKEAFNRVFWNGKAYRHSGYEGETDDRVQA